MIQHFGVFKRNGQVFQFRLYLKHVLVGLGFKSQVELGGDFADRTMRRRSASTQLSKRHLEPPLLENKSDIKRNEIKLI